MEIHLLRSVNCDCSWTDFHNIHACSTTFCKELSYGISWKSHIRFLRWYYVTDGLANMVCTSVFIFLRKEHLNVIYNWQGFLHHELRNTAQSVLSISELLQLKIYSTKFTFVCKWFQNLLLLLETKCEFSNATSQVSVIHVIKERYRIVGFFSWIQKFLCSCLPSSSDLFCLFVT